jgi:dCTP deaminase
MNFVVNQEGGYQNGILYLVHGGDVVHPAGIGNNQEEDDQLLQVGSTYLFAARYYEQKDWYTITSHPNGRKLISSDSNLDKVTLENLAKNDEKVLKLQEAYKHEILLESDVKNNNTRNSYQSLQEKNEVEEIDITGGYELSPGKLYLGSTIEKIGLRDWVGELGGKSSIGRLGISVHVTAGFIDPGFYGNITLEIWVVERAIIYPGMRIGQIWFTRVDGDYDSYSKVGHYREELANGVVASMSWKQIEEDDYENRKSNDIGDR